MEIRRATYGAAIRLAIVLSAVATVITMGLDLLGDVSPAAMALSVALVGFVTSWVVTGRVSREVAARSHHRVSYVPVHHSLG